MNRLIELIEEVLTAGRRPQVPRVAPWVQPCTGSGACSPGPAPWVVGDHVVLEEASQAALRHSTGGRATHSREALSCGEKRKCYLGRLAAPVVQLLSFLSSEL
jgi:hypothetical protein